ncbi:MAG: hypothetical protein ACTS5I_07565 [Rhodanobacter sp.]
MDQEIRDDRKAARREEVQRHREWLRGRDLGWLMEYLLEHGPVTEHVAMIEAMDEEYDLEKRSRRGLDVLCGLYSLWMVRKLWRRPMGKHPGSGEESYLYGVRGIHDAAHWLR